MWMTGGGLNPIEKHPDKMRFIMLGMVKDLRDGRIQKDEEVVRAGNRFIKGKGTEQKQVKTK